MRPDLNKLLCERERRPAGAKHREYRRRRPFVPARPGEEGENFPAREGMKKRYGYDGKSFNENLTPLYGAVRKALGRRWDDFYSDLCKVFDMRSVINQHILQHLEQYCERKDIEVHEDGRLYVKPTRFSDSARLLSQDVNVEFYVDPRDGIIKRNRGYRTSGQISREGKAARMKRDAAVRRMVDEDTELRKVDGVWYVLTIKDVPPGKWIEKVSENGWKQRTYDGQPMICALTRQFVYYEERARYRNGSRGPVPANRYYATRRTAPHRLLKQQGIVK